MLESWAQGGESALPACLGSREAFEPLLVGGKCRSSDLSRPMPDPCSSAGSGW